MTSLSISFSFLFFFKQQSIILFSQERIQSGIGGSCFQLGQKSGVQRPHLAKSFIVYHSSPDSCSRAMNWRISGPEALEFRSFRFSLWKWLGFRKWSPFIGVRLSYPVFIKNRWSLQYHTSKHFLSFLDRNKF